jgi:hypothetical protein
MAVAAAALYFWSGSEPNSEALRFSVFLLGYLLLLDIIKMLKRK